MKTSATQLPNVLILKLLLMLADDERVAGWKVRKFKVGRLDGSKV